MTLVVIIAIPIIQSNRIVGIDLERPGVISNRCEQRTILDQYTQLS